MKGTALSKSFVIIVTIMAIIGCFGFSVKPTFAQEKFQYEEITVDELVKGYEEHNFTTEEVVQAYLDRIRKYENSYNAFTFINSDALKEAKEIDRLREKGAHLGPLAGVPIVIKESVDVLGYPSTAGWNKFSKEAGGIELMPTADAVLVQRLKDAGAIILGKTNIPAFSGSGTNADSSWAGPTFNALDKTLVPGGSSSGTATAVSGNFTVLGIGEETGGSIQNPAAAQDIVGIKPTFGLIPTKGIVPITSSIMDTAGPHARTVKDAALLLNVIAGYSPQDSNTIGSMEKELVSYTSDLASASLKGRRLGILGPSWRTNLKVSAETKLLYQRSIDEIKREGAEVVEDPFSGTGFAQILENESSRGIESFFYDQQRYVENLLVDGQTGISLKQLYNKIGTVPWEPGSSLSNWITYAFDVNKALNNPKKKPDLTAFNYQREQLRDIIDQVINKYHLDGFVYPQAIAETPKVSSKEQIESVTVPEINYSGLPIITVPAGKYKSGAAFELAFFGKAWSEKSLIEIAYAYEQATHYREAPTLVASEGIPQLSSTNRKYPIKKVLYERGEFEEVAATVMVNGHVVDLEGYDISGQFVFKLRDLAAVLDGTDKQFDVKWNSANRTITVLKGKHYTSLNSNEGLTSQSFIQRALKYQTIIDVEGKQHMFTGFNIGEYTFLRMEDLASLAQVEVKHN